MSNKIITEIVGEIRKMIDESIKRGITDKSGKAPDVSDLIEPKIKGVVKMVNKHTSQAVEEGRKMEDDVYAHMASFFISGNTKNAVKCTTNYVRDTYIKPLYESLENKE